MSTSSQAINVLAAPAPPSLLTQSNQLYAGRESKVAVPQYSGNVTLLASGCQGGTLSWTGPNNSSGIGDISVSTNTVGTFEYSVVCQSSGCNSTPASVTVVVQAAPLQVVAPLFDCATNKLTLRTTGGNGQPIEYHIPSVTQGWTTTNLITVQAKNFKKEKLKLSARQLTRNNTNYEVVKLDYQLPTCPSAREGATGEPVTELQVRVLGNPVVGSQLVVEVRGAEGQRLHLQVNDISGRMVNTRLIEQASALEQVSQCPAGVLALRVSTVSQTKTVKLIKE
ncbi:T9SS type A sorting domain-containing protein [Spirosoma soli]|uniref:T9SS type A sorting domain-containing protein n=2 Tax=Spirosoma soli TaxID=1770529 RepID=A0ABW5MDC4_9BACT